MKKKILIIIVEMNIGGGAERSASLLANNLSGKYNVSILTFIHSKTKYIFKGKYYSLKENLGILNKIFYKSKINNIIRIFKIYKKIKQITPDIIISITDFANIPVLLSKLIFRLKIPLIISVRINPKKQYEKKNKHLNFFIKRLYRLNLINKIVTVSKELNLILEHFYQIQSDKLKTIYNGIDFELINEKKSEEITDYKELFNNERIIRFITVGRLAEQKGHRDLIKAFFNVQKVIDNSRLIIIGEGPLKQELKDLIKKLNLKNKIFLIGMKKNPFKYIAKSHIFILSSYYEGFPNVLLEALACGIPIISNDCKTGPNEILKNGKYGFLVKTKDIEDLSEKMISLARNNSLLIEYAKKSIERAKNFNIEKNKKEWINLINNYLSNH